MAAKSKKPSRAATAPAVDADASCTLKPPLTLEEHVHRIEAIRKRIDAYVQFMCQIATQPGMSAEVRERAVRTFYKEMIAVETRLGRIHDELRLE